MQNIDNTDSPFPIDLVNYNRIEFSERWHIWIPIFNEKPMIIEDNKTDENIFVYAKNYFNILEFLDELENIEEQSIDVLFEEISCFADFQYKSSQINAVLLSEKYNETYYFEDGKNDAKMLRYIKTIKEDGSTRTAFNFNLLNKDNYLPIEKRSLNNTVFEKFYHIDDGKVFLSFCVHEDLPFEVYKDEKGFSFKDYLIPNVKLKRSRVYLPSQIEFNKNGDVVDFKYFINNKDFTSKALTILNKMNIDNPVKHIFTEHEIDTFVNSIYI